MKDKSKVKVRYGIVGCGVVSAVHHVPGISIDERAIVTMICEPNAELLAQRMEEWGDINPGMRGCADYKELCADPEIDCVIVATPNFSHHEIVMECLAQKKHCLAEKPLGLNAAQAQEMALAAKEAGVCNMTAFTYRFAPAMRYLKQLCADGSLGELRHFRSQRFLDWPETSWGWRQYKKTAGAGNLYDMTTHRIDFAEDLMGPIQELTGAVAQFAKRTKTPGGDDVAESEVDDWTSLIGRFESGAVGVWEGSTLMKGYNQDGLGREWGEVNGSEATAIYQVNNPNVITMGKHKGQLEEIPVPEELLKAKGSPRDPSKGKPGATFRLDLVFEMTSAIVEGRDAECTFLDGAKAQTVADCVLKSSSGGKWEAVDRSWEAACEK